MNVGRVLGAVMVTVWAALLSAPAPLASAQPCPDVEVIFARGTGEPPGVGGVGQSFVDAVRSQAGGKSVGVYAVNYPASADFGNGIQFAQTIVNGLFDAGSHIQSTAANCPNTRMVIGGYSQGAVIAGFLTSSEIPPEIPSQFVSLVPQPLPPEIANHVAAVAMFGRPSDQFLTQVGAPPMRIGPLYAGKTIDLCAPGDTICDGAPAGGPTAAHGLYPVNGMVSEAAAFAVSRL
jgi:cutinase